MPVVQALTVLEPIAESVTNPESLAPRLSTLDGKVIGLYSNKKLNADRLLELVEEELKSRHELAGVVRSTYTGMRLMKRDEWRDVEECDAIILTHGD